MMDRHMSGIEPGEEDLLLARSVIETLIFPNVPQTDHEIEVVVRAIRLQAIHTMSVSAEMPMLPSNVESFQIGHFQMHYRNSKSWNDICPTARSLLLREGLLYKGVERTPVTRTPVRPVQPPDLTPHPLPTREDRIDRQQARPRDSWSGYQKPKPVGNPPPDGIPPQGDPPIPGLPVIRRTNKNGRRT